MFVRRCSVLWTQASLNVNDNLNRVFGKKEKNNLRKTGYANKLIVYLASLAAPPVTSRPRGARTSRGAEAEPRWLCVWERRAERRRPGGEKKLSFLHRRNTKQPRENSDAVFHCWKWEGLFFCFFLVVPGVTSLCWASSGRRGGSLHPQDQPFILQLYVYRTRWLGYGSWRSWTLVLETRLRDVIVVCWR